MADFPIQTLIDDLKEERKNAINALRHGLPPGKHSIDMDAIKELAALHGAILALESQRDEDSPWPAGDSVEPESFPDD